MAYQCAECTTVKRMDVDPKYGFIIGKPRYEYPDWFQLKRGTGDGTERLTSPNAVRVVLSDRDVNLPMQAISHEGDDGSELDA